MAVQRKIGPNTIATENGKYSIRKCCAPLVDWKDNEVEEENEGYKFESNGVHDSQYIGGKRGAQAPYGEGGEYVNPHKPDALELNEPVCKVGPVAGGNIEEPNDKSYMDELSRGKGEAEITPVPRQDREGRSEQFCHRGTRVGQPK